MKTDKEKKTAIEIKDASSSDISIEFSATGGKSVILRIKSDNSETHVTIDGHAQKEVVEFLINHYKASTKNNWTTSFKPTGRAIAVIDLKEESVVYCLDSYSSPLGCVHESDDMTYETFRKILRGKVELKPEYVVVCFNLVDKGIPRAKVLEVMRASVCYQKAYLLSGSPFDALTMTLNKVEDLTGIDISNVSRSANYVDIFSEAGRFCMERTGKGKYPSIFDEGVKKTDGTVVPRKEVLNLINDIFASENPAKPYVDEDVSEMLLRKGYIVARRTVTKYREIIGIPKSSVRRVR